VGAKASDILLFLIPALSEMVESEEKLLMSGVLEGRTGVALDAFSLRLLDLGVLLLLPAIIDTLFL